MLYQRLQKERKAKHRREIEADLKMSKAKTLLRQENEKRLKEKLGVQETLIEFHKPVVEQMVKEEQSRIEGLKSVQEAIEDLSLLPSPYPALEDRQTYKVNFNKGLNEVLLKRLEFDLPSELINKTAEELDGIIQKANEQNKKWGQLKGPAVKAYNNAKDEDVREANREKVVGFDYNIRMVKTYIKALKALKEGMSYTGDGLDYLHRLTTTLCERPTQKLHNRIVEWTDRLLRDGEITNDQAKRYYDKFLL